MRIKKRNSTKLIVVHCTSTTASQRYGVRELTLRHSEAGALTIGFHFVINRKGELEIGRQEEAIGSSIPSIDDEAVHVCLVGDEDNFTRRQFTTLRTTLRLLRARYSDATIQAHHEFDSSVICPAFDLDSFLRDAHLDKHVATKPHNLIT